ncbi:MAG TPA: hypothetical protein VLV50_13440 [Stellaceae bacterium]|nr:hypothetical protein [Stellaceae bacterium]
MSVVRPAALLAVVGAAASLAGCNFGSTREGLNCPSVVNAPNADTIAIFRPGGHDAKDVAVGGKIYKVTSTCEREKEGVVINAELTFYAQRAALETKSVTLPYFVALVDPQQRVLSEESFQVQLPFPAAEFYRESAPEKITVHLPLTDRTQASAFSVVVGFQLTPDQIAFNRAAHPQ